MITAVFDSNVIVSALWSKDGTPAKLLNLVLNNKIKLCYDSCILDEYRSVLLRPKFGFSISEVEDLMQFIETTGYSVIAEPLFVSFIDESDRKFYEVARSIDALLITGNKKHFPDEQGIFTPAEFMMHIHEKEEDR